MPATSTVDRAAAFFFAALHGHVADGAGMGANTGPVTVGVERAIAVAGGSAYR